MTNPPPKDRPGVIAPPPLIAMLAVVFGLLLERRFPSLGLRDVSLWLRIAIGAALAIAGGLLALAAERRFKAVGTNVPPWKPTLALAAGGVYERLRNPMYVGLLLLVAGIAVALASVWTLVMAAAMAVVLHYGVVLREERYLDAKFGEEYRRYCRRVPRWGLF